jgi:hypothetical protein
VGPDAGLCQCPFGIESFRRPGQGLNVLPRETAHDLSEKLLVRGGPGRRTGRRYRAGAHLRKRHRIENMFGKLKDWRRIHTRYDRDLSAA